MELVTGTVLSVSGDVTTISEGSNGLLMGLCVDTTGCGGTEALGFEVAWGTVSTSIGSGLLSGEVGREAALEDTEDLTWLGFAVFFPSGATGGEASARVSDAKCWRFWAPRVSGRC